MTSEKVYVDGVKYIREDLCADRAPAADAELLEAAKSILQTDHLPDCEMSFAPIDACYCGTKRLRKLEQAIARAEAGRGKP